MRTLLVLLLLAVSLSVSAQTPYLVKDINTTTSSTPHSSLPDGFFRLGSRVYFTATELGKRGRELWSTDGTPAGTALVVDIVPGTASSYPSHFAALNGKLVFNAYDEAHSEELWITDGTATGTTQLKDIVPGPNGSNPGSFAIFNDTVYFSAANNLWTRHERDR